MALPFISFVISAATTIAAAVANAGPAIAIFAEKIAPTLAKIAKVAGPIITEVVKLAGIILPIFNVFTKDDKVDDMGERALQAAENGIVFSEFDDFDEYVQALRDFELDPEIAQNRDPIVKTITGLGIGTIGLEEKFDLNRGDLNGIWLLPAGDEKYFTPNRLEDFLTSGKLVGNIFDYLNNQLSASDARDFEKKLDTGMNENESDQLYQALENATAKIAELNTASE